MEPYSIGDVVGALFLTAIVILLLIGAAYWSCLLIILILRFLKIKK